MARRLTERDVIADGIRIHLVEAGEGPALILLHGLTASHFTWEHTIPAFADRWRVIAPDLPGHGRSDKPDAPYTIDFYAGVIRSLARALDVEEAFVVGNSLGGQIAVELGLAYPRFTRALVLAAPAGGYASGMRAVGWAIEGLAGPRTLRLALPRALGFCFHDARQPAYVARRTVLLERLTHEDYPRFARAVSRSLRGALAAGRQPLERLFQPTLLVWGRHDRLVALSGSRRLLRAVPHARLAVLEGCGHLPMVEQPARFNHVVTDFLRVVEASPVPGAAAARGARPVAPRMDVSGRLS